MRDHAAGARGTGRRVRDALSRLLDELVPDDTDRRMRMRVLLASRPLRLAVAVVCLQLVWWLSGMGA